MNIGQPPSKAAVANVELHVAHGCNLSCESCSHFSNQGHKGLLEIDEADRWMRAWKDRISPHTFSLLGGEPTIHPELEQFVSVTRRHWPQARLRLVTNGFFLHRHPGLPRLLEHDANATICLSIHHGSAEYQQQLAPALHLLETWTTNYGVQVEYYWSYHRWTRRYKGFGALMEPFEDNDARASWNHCTGRMCMQLMDGKLWKCAPLAYLPMQDAKYGLSEKWRPYLEYQPLPSDCSDEQLAEFVAREEESCCTMCPAKPEVIPLPLPLARAG